MILISGDSIPKSFCDQVDASSAPSLPLTTRHFTSWRLEEDGMEHGETSVLILSNVELMMKNQECIIETCIRLGFPNTNSSKIRSFWY